MRYLNNVTPPNSYVISVISEAPLFFPSALATKSFTYKNHTQVSIHKRTVTPTFSATTRNVAARVLTVLTIHKGGSGLWL